MPVSESQAQPDPPSENMITPKQGDESQAAYDQPRVKAPKPPAHPLPADELPDIEKMREEANQHSILVTLYDRDQKLKASMERSMRSEQAHARSQKLHWNEVDRKISAMLAHAEDKFNKQWALLGMPSTVEKKSEYEDEVLEVFSDAEIIAKYYNTLLNHFGQPFSRLTDRVVAGAPVDDFKHKLLKDLPADHMVVKHIAPQDEGEFHAFCRKLLEVHWVRRQI